MHTETSAYVCPAKDSNAVTAMAKAPCPDGTFTPCLQSPVRSAWCCPRSPEQTAWWTPGSPAHGQTPAGRIATTQQVKQLVSTASYL
jgi:hypothetical protein